MLGAGQIFGFYNGELAIQAIDWNVVFLLGCMMAIIAIMLPTGGFEWLAGYCARAAKGRQFLLMAPLVMGAYGHRGWREYLMGSSAIKLLNYATIPVFVHH